MKDIGVVLRIYEWELFYILINPPIAILNFSWQERSCRQILHVNVLRKIEE
jgi:hypothetical protein